MYLLLHSFGFKHGLAPEADFVFDVRCLPNPYWKPELSKLTGLDTPVMEYLEGIPEVQDLLSDLYRFIAKWVPTFEADNRNQVSIAIGCTGGQHRSVYMVEKLAKKIRLQIPNTEIRHRDLKLPR